MKSIIYVGIDVHKNQYTLSSYTFENDKNFATATIEASSKSVLKYLERVGRDKNAEFQVGYEAGCCGFVLYEELKKAGVDCMVMAPSTMPSRKNEIKTDKRDAMKISRCLATGSYRAVYVPTKEDRNVKEYVRMRDDHKLELKRIKLQISGFCLRHGFIFTEGKSYWTQKHMAWLEKLEMDAMLREVLDEYLLTYKKLSERLETFDKRIEEISKNERHIDGRTHGEPFHCGNQSANNRLAMPRAVILKFFSRVLKKYLTDLYITVCRNFNRQSNK